MILKKLFMSLFIFDGGEGAGSSSDGNGADGANGIDNSVGEGQLATDTAESGTSGADDAKETEAEIVDRFIKEHKAEYEKRFKSAVNERLKGSNQLRRDNESMRNVLDRVMTRYDAKDIEELGKKLDSDRDYYRSAAAEKGMSEEAYREYEQMKLQLQRQEQTERQRAKDEFMQNLFRQADAVKAQYPDFDLDAEMENEEFASLVKHGTPLQHAYQVIHLPDIMDNAIQQARLTASQQTAEAMRSGKSRAHENGTGKGTPSRAGSIDIAKLTPEQCEEYERQALRGKRISFG